MTTNQNQDNTTEKELSLEEKLAIKLGIISKNGKPNLNELKKLIYQEVINNSENITSIEMIGKAISKYSNQKILEVNEAKKQAAYERLERIVNELKEEGQKVSKSKLNQKHGFSYKTLNDYLELNPNAF